MILPRALARADDVIGEAVEGRVMAHHDRRLGRLGRRSQLDPPEDGSLWVAGDPPPREGCDLEVLIDGEPALAEIAAALERARSQVHIAGWHLTPDFGLHRATSEPGGCATCWESWRSASR